MVSSEELYCFLTHEKFCLMAGYVHWEDHPVNVKKWNKQMNFLEKMIDSYAMCDNYDIDGLTIKIHMSGDGNSGKYVEGTLIDISGENYGRVLFTPTSPISRNGRLMESIVLSENMIYDILVNKYGRINWDNIILKDEDEQE